MQIKLTGGWFRSRKEGFCVLFVLLESRGAVLVSVKLFIQIEVVGFVLSA